jgi:AAA15 family ATPase/GTPase
MKLQIENFRSLLNTGPIEIKPITVLIGKNSSGKSSFLRTFPLLKQSVEERTKSPILMYGRFVDFGSSYEDLKPRFSDGNYTLSFTFDKEFST